MESKPCLLWSLGVERDSILIRVCVPPRARERCVLVQATSCSVKVAVDGLQDQMKVDISLPESVRIKQRQVEAQYSSQTGVLLLRCRRQRTRDVDVDAPQKSVKRRKGPVTVDQKSKDATKVRQEAVEPSASRLCQSREEQQTQTGSVWPNPQPRAELTELNKTRGSNRNVSIQMQAACGGSSSVERVYEAEIAASVPRTVAQATASPLRSTIDSLSHPRVATRRVAVDARDAEQEQVQSMTSLETKLERFLETAVHGQILQVLRQIRRLYLRRTADPHTLWRKMARAHHDLLFAGSFLRLVIKAVLAQGDAERAVREQRLISLIEQSMNRCVVRGHHRRRGDECLDNTTERTIAEQVGAQFEQKMAQAQQAAAAMTTELAAREHERSTRKLQKLAWQMALTRRALETKSDQPPWAQKSSLKKAGKDRRRGAARVTFLLDNKKVHLPA